MIITTPPLTERNPGIYKPDRPCKRCEAILITSNPGPYCQPCQLAMMPEEERCDPD